MPSDEKRPSVSRARRRAEAALPDHTPELADHTPELADHTPELADRTPELADHTPELPDITYEPDPESLPGQVADPIRRAFDFDERLRTAPDRPGVYVMRDRNGEVVYIGKAASLKARLRQYASGQDERFFVHLLHHVLGSIELVVTATAKDALLVENDLIKRHQPRFNVKLKDDKRFIHLRLAGDEDFPRLQVVRRPAQDGAQYFGPYASASAARATLAQVNRHFQLRTCPDSVFRNRTRPCLEYQIHRCLGPCVLPVDPAEYAGHTRDVTLLLTGRRKELLARLKDRMAQAAEDEQFERAARYRDQVHAIEQSLEQQTVNLLGEKRSFDAVGLFRQGARACVAVLSFREGVLLGSQGHVLKDQEWPDAEVLEGFLTQLYDRGQPVPDEVLLPAELPDAEVLADWLTDLRRTRAALEAVPGASDQAVRHSRGAVEVLHPQRGAKVRLVEMAMANAQQVFEEQDRTAGVALKTLEGLQRRLHLRSLPRRIECYDISNISGTDPVGSMSVALDGELAPKAYRHYSIRSMETPNDFAMMREVLGRRFQRVKDGEGAAPDLVVIDGGKGQLKMAMQVFEDLGIYDVDLVGLAKARTLDTDDQGPSQSSPERLFLPGAKNALVLPQNSNEMYLLVRLRDEAHRFGVTFHRKRRAARTLRSRLDQVPGVGPTRKKALLETFGSLKGIAAASDEELAAVPGIGPEVVKRVRLVVRKPKPDGDLPPE